MLIKPNWDDFAAQTTRLVNGAIVAPVAYGKGGSCLHGIPSSNVPFPLARNGLFDLTLNWT